MAKSPSGGSMLSGLINRSPKGDSGMRPPSGSVNSDTTRSATAPQPSMLGPRTA